MKNGENEELYLNTDLRIIGIIKNLLNLCFDIIIPLSMIFYINNQNRWKP